MSVEGNVLVAQSGGPTVAINASLAGVISAAMGSRSIRKVYGAKHGIQGFLEEDLLVLSDLFDTKEKLEALKTTPSMYLGSCRYKLKDFKEDDSDYSKIIKLLKKYDIKYFFYIGGNDSMDTVAKLSAYAEQMDYEVFVMGIPKTIDNDLMEIDHTPGFGSAAKYIATSILEIAHDTYTYNLPSVLVVEIMGRNAGWLTAASALARNEYSAAPHLIYLPEKKFSTAKFIQDVKQKMKEHQQVIIAVSEGIKDMEGAYVSSQASHMDNFGHVRLSGTGKYLEELIHDSIGCKVRAVELNVLQRSAAHIASLTDINEAFELGSNGVKYALAGCTGFMATLKRISDEPYKAEYGMADINKVANKEKKIPDEWITKENNDVTEEMIQYLKPLIYGETVPQYENGLPKYLFYPAD